MYILDENSKEALHIQLYKALKEDIVSNYKVREKIPSIRKMATLYNISKTTVESAYSQLYAEGFLESFPKSAYRVSDMFHKDFQADKKPISLHTEHKVEYAYDFFPAQLTSDSFPLKLFKRLFNQNINDSLDFGSYHDGAGEIGLRNEITKYLSTSRGVTCSASQIIVCSGFSDAMGLLAKLVRQKYNYFGMEHPGYHVARRVFEEYNYNIEKIAVKTDGISLTDLKKSKAQIVYITPSHQYPTGVIIPVAKRQKILEYINSIDGLIIEDDYDSELSYYNRPIPALQGLDQCDRVVYMGTFAKSLSPTLRVSYMVLPYHLLPLFKQSYDAHFPRVSLAIQKTLEAFLAQGHWERHVRKIRTLNKKKHNLMKKLLQDKLGESMKIIAEGGGLAILIYPSIIFDLEKLKQEAHKAKIKLYFAKDRSGGDFEAIRMGFGGFTLEELPQAIEAFTIVWKKTIIH